MTAKAATGADSTAGQSKFRSETVGKFLVNLKNRPPKDRAFVGGDLRNTVHQGREGFELTVRLTSYRALPLSCIEGIELKIDGQVVDPASLVLILDNHSYKLEDLPTCSHLWWFILDSARLFAPWSSKLASGDHDVEGTLITVEPYITAGRFSFFNSSRKKLRLKMTPQEQ